MRQLIATLRRRPGPPLGSLVALFVASMLVTVMASLTGAGGQIKPPAGLAGAAVVVTGALDLSVHAGHGDSADTERMALPGYRRLPSGLAGRLAGVPGVRRAIAQVSFPVSLELPGGGFDAGTGAAPLAGLNWPSSALAPFGKISGSAPRGDRDIVVGAGLARRDHLRPGDQVRLAGRDLPPFTVTGVAAARGRAAAPGRAAAWGREQAQRDAVFFSPREAAALYGHPGQADLIGVIAARGVRAATLAGRIRAAAGGGYSVLTGADRGRAADPADATDGSDLQALGAGVGIDIALIALFVVAGAVALSVGLRRREFALLRAVGATGGQIRRALAGELAVLGVAGGLLGYLPGCWLASWAVRAMTARGLLPGGSAAWNSPLNLIVAVGSGLVVAELSGFVAARRAGRVHPADALRESSAERWWPHPVRIVLGLGALGGAIWLLYVTLGARTSDQLNQAFPLLLLFMLAVALLGPLLVALAELAVRLPGRGIGGIGGRLALADVAARPRRIASAVIPVALSVAMIGAVYFVGATVSHGALAQGRQRLVADLAVSAPGPGLTPGALAAIRSQAGVTSAVGLAPLDISVLDPDLDPLNGEAVSSGALTSVLAPGVVAGSLARFGRGDVAVSTQEAGSGAMGARVGQLVTVYLPDGAPYRARLTATYSRSLGFADVLIPAAVAAGHAGPLAYAQILVRGSGRPGALAARISRLSGRYPGLSVVSRRVMNAQAQRQDAQDGFVNALVLVVIALLAAVALVNTLVVATLERRESLRLLRRVGATAGQLASMTAWQSVLVSVVGIGLGAAAGAATLASVARALTGSWRPWIPLPPAAVIIGLVLALAMAATLGPAAALLRRDAPGLG